MQTTKISFIVPIYGVEKYISRFLNSLTPNLQPGVEVILVDDGSKDNCGKIIDEYQQQHPDSVKTIHKKNGGLSSARNAGLAISKGEYVTFPDPDDYLSNTFTIDIYAAIEDYDSPDMIFYDYYNCDGKNLNLQTVPNFKEGIVSRTAFLTEFAKDEAIKSMVWQKVIKKEFFTGLNFDQNVRVAEDALLLTDLALKLKKFVYLKKPLYYWVIRESSLTHSATLEDEIKVFLVFEDRYIKYIKHINNLSITLVTKHAYNVLRRAAIENHVSDTVIHCKNLIRNNIRTILFDKDIRLNDKKQYLLVYLGVADYYNKWKYGKSDK